MMKMNEPKRRGIEYPMFMFCGIVRFEDNSTPVSLFQNKDGVKFVMSTDRSYIDVEDVAEGIVRRKRSG
jgi:hypothetical protein